MAGVYVSDKNGTQWELFLDHAYFDMYCVKQRWDDEYESPSTSFHFVEKSDAEKFLELIEKSM